MPMKREGVKWGGAKREGVKWGGAKREGVLLFSRAPAPPAPERPGHHRAGHAHGDQRHRDPGELGCSRVARYAHHVLPHPLPNHRWEQHRSPRSSRVTQTAVHAHGADPGHGVPGCWCGPGTRRGAARHGRRSPTATTDSRPASTVPHTPAAPTLAAQSTSAIRAEWVAPNDGGEAITSYSIRWRIGSGAYADAERPDGARLRHRRAGSPIRSTAVSVRGGELGGEFGVVCGGDGEHGRGAGDAVHGAGR